jgi:DNA-binding MarR family transcriptional regulator
MKDLTPRQREILAVVSKYEADTGAQCRFTYLADRLAITVEAVRHHASALHRKGWLKSAGSPIERRQSGEQALKSS